MEVWLEEEKETGLTSQSESRKTTKKKKKKKKKKKERKLESKRKKRSGICVDRAERKEFVSRRKEVSSSQTATESAPGAQSIELLNERTFRLLSFSLIFYPLHNLYIQPTTQSLKDNQGTPKLFLPLLPSMYLYPPSLINSTTTFE